MYNLIVIRLVTVFLILSLACYQPEKTIKARLNMRACIVYYNIDHRIPHLGSIEFLGDGR